MCIPTTADSTCFLYLQELFNDLKQNLNNLYASRPQENVGEEKDEYFDKTYIVEYSSPNIAKPFHVGNLRSAIIGNSVANILQFMGHNILRMNYLGDWGTQFGILSLAFEHFGNEEMLESNPMRHLLNVYVEGNKGLIVVNKIQKFK